MPQIEVMNASPVFFWMICFVSVTALAISKSGFGGALGSLSMPIMLFVLPPKLALGVLLPIFLITDIWVVYIWRKHVHWRFVIIMCVFGLAGQMAGWLLFDYFSNAMLRAAVGTIGVLTAVNYLRRLIWPQTELPEDIARRLMARLWPRAAGWCGMSGLASFVALAGGIPAQVFLLPHRLARQVFVGTMSVYFFIINLSKLPFYGDLGLFSAGSLKMSLLLLPCIPLGVYFGKWLNEVVSDRLFYHVTYSILFIMGVKLLWDAATAWPA
tara:strand:- start:5057 stop:5863 length:807 start_codon:yes stop_codon:yes gene_type:complete